jgi:hypothetical protein
MDYTYLYARALGGKKGDGELGNWGNTPLSLLVV